MYLGITRLYAVLHGTFVISCLGKNFGFVGNVIPPFLVFAGLTFGSCRRQTVMPQFDIVVTDTVAVRGGIPCRFQYAFTSIANADEARHCRRSRNQYALFLPDWSISRAGCRRLSIGLIGQFMDEYIGTPGLSRYPSGNRNGDGGRVRGPSVDTLLVYTISSSNYTGGAHGMYSINCHNYVIAGGL